MPARRRLDPTIAPGRFFAQAPDRGQSGPSPSPGLTGTRERTRRITLRHLGNTLAGVKLARMQSATARSYQPVPASAIDIGCGFEKAQSVFARRVASRMSDGVAP